MATVSTPTVSTLPLAGGDIIAAPLAGWITNLKNFVEGQNIDENNVDYTSADGIMVMAQAQTITGLKTFEDTSAAAGGIRTAAKFSHNPATGTPADNDGVDLWFLGDDDGGNQTTFAKIEVKFTDVSDTTEDANITLYNMVAGSLVATAVIDAGGVDLAAGKTFSVNGVDIGLAYANDGDNRIVTGDGSGGLNGEANLTFDGNVLEVKSDAILAVGISDSATTTPASYFTGAQKGIVSYGGDGQTSKIVIASQYISADEQSGQLAFVLDNAGTTVDGAVTYNHASQFMTFHTAVSERMRIDSSGNVGIGVSPDNLLHVYKGDSGATPNVDGIFLENSSSAAITIGTGTTAEGMLHFADSGAPNSGRIVYDHNANAMYFATGATERMRIDSSGDVGIGTSTMSGIRFNVSQDTTDEITARFISTAASPYGMQVLFSAASPDNNTNYFFRAADSTTIRSINYANGNWANHDGTYGTISDVKFKQDIGDARSYWDDFKSLQYRKFRHKADVEADENTPYRLGLIAQEVEAVFPALVPESPDPLVPIVDVDGEPVLDVDGEPTYEEQTTHKWVKSSIIEGPIMASVVQELQERDGEKSSRILALEARVAALEAM